MLIQGGCHCGEISYQAKVDPARVIVCHCSDCQALSGSAFRSLVVCSADDFRLLSGSPRTYIKTAESGRQRVQAFCEICGSALYSTSPGDGPADLGIRLGTVKERHLLTPRKQIWCQSEQPWLKNLGNIPRFDKQ